MAAYQSRNQAFGEGVNGGPAANQANPAFHGEGPLMVGNMFHAQNGMGKGFYGYSEPYDSFMVNQAKSGGGEGAPER